MFWTLVAGKRNWRKDSEWTAETHAENEELLDDFEFTNIGVKIYLFSPASFSPG